MEKSGSTMEAIPSSVRNVRHSNTMKGGQRNWNSALAPPRPVARAPNLVMPPACEVIPSLTPSAYSSTEHGAKSLTSSLHFMNPLGGAIPTSRKTSASPIQSPCKRLVMPVAKASMTFISTWHMRPKSRKTRSPLSVNRRLPSCGSACTHPVRISWATAASTALPTISTCCSLVRSLIFLPSIHSMVSTRAVPLGPMYSYMALGVLTNPRKACRRSNSAAFSASKW
mmetsp:Transcript_15571/g.21510  ORF Transcript_15571/g.21510 Transcript_15571/m.21510 type:complete len:226 (+) Transcript_15571:738-1415(+)